ncbi:hypothetical protein MFAL_08630 [Mycolicibacterium fallax]|nr:hypothetical protein MFAL_08630 [Mycolicibacterium fallax]
MVITVFGARGSDPAPKVTNLRDLGTGSSGGRAEKWSQNRHGSRDANDTPQCCRNDLCDLCNAWVG